MKNITQNTNKTISVLLVLVMLAVSAPVAFAAEPVALTEANVAVWPTIEGEIYTGQKLSDGLTVTGGTVTTDGTSEGTVIPGKFEFINPDYISAKTSEFADLKFIPENTTEFLGFEVENVLDVTYRVQAVTPVLVDATNDSPVAQKVTAAGQRLLTSTILGGAVKNPITGEVIPNTKWNWVKPIDVVNESGYFEARLAAGTGYNVITMMIYVGIVDDISETEISSVPTVSDELTYDGITTWADVALAGGLAVEKDTTTAVEGTFAITDSWKRKVIESGSYEIDAIFTPNDSEAYTKAEFKIPVTVNKGTVKFIDESGNETVPEITLDRVLKVGSDLDGYLKPYLNASCSFNWEETEGYGEKIKPGTHMLTVKTIIDDTNYERYGTLTFKATMNKEKITAKVKNVVGGRQIYFEGGDVIHLNGDFDIKCLVDGNETQLIKGVKLNETFVINQNKSGVYSYEIVYNSAADDYCDVTVSAQSETVVLNHSVTVNGGEAVEYACGATVSITAPANEKPYYVFDGWAENSVVSSDSLGSETIRFTMPDGDVELNANYKFSLKAFFIWLWQQICGFFNLVLTTLGGWLGVA